MQTFSLSFIVSNSIIIGAEIKNLPPFLNLSAYRKDLMWFGIFLFVVLMFTPAVLGRGAVLKHKCAFLKEPNRDNFESYSNCYKGTKWIVNIMKGAFFMLTVAGSMLAAFYTKTGTLMAINGTIQERLLEKLGSNLDNHYEKAKNTFENLRIDLENAGNIENTNLESSNNSLLGDVALQEIQS